MGDYEGVAYGILFILAMVCQYFASYVFTIMWGVNIEYDFWAIFETETQYALELFIIISEILATVFAAIGIMHTVADNPPFNYIFFSFSLILETTWFITTSLRLFTSNCSPNTIINESRPFSAYDYSILKMGYNASSFNLAYNDIDNKCTSYNMGTRFTLFWIGFLWGVLPIGVVLYYSISFCCDLCC